MCGVLDAKKIFVVGVVEDCVVLYVIHFCHSADITGAGRWNFVCFLALQFDK